MDSLVFSRLQSLASLQKIDSRLDRLRQIRGDLPEEVRDMEDEIEGLQTRLDRLEEEVDAHQRDITQRKGENTRFAEALKKYEAQLLEIRNNKEFEGLNENIRLASLEIKANELKIQKATEKIHERELQIELLRKNITDRQTDLKLKKEELSILVEETEVEEQQLLVASQEAEQHIESRLLLSYKRIRQNMRNGLAVVTMERGACGGCFAIIPPQRQYEIRQITRIIVCENCGRILVDESLFQNTAEGVAAA
jgi:predicted  nucleic acid-binding Zn-ribbon protein